MGKISTNELFDLYFNSPEIAGTSIQTNRRQIDKPQLYVYEKEIGKELIDMDVDDLFGLIQELCNKRKGKKVEYVVSHASYDQLSTILRAVFNYYIDNIEVIRNPLNDKRMRGKEAVKRLAEGFDTFSWKNVEDVIRQLHIDREQDSADYIELIMLMYYSGFACSDEIINLKADMINHEDHTVSFPNGRFIRLTDRCYELLMKFADLDVMPWVRGDFALVPWHGGFFKFIVRPSQVYKVNERPISMMRNQLNHVLSVYVNDKYDTKINYRILYLLGFYDFLVKKYGEERTEEMFNSYRNSDDVRDILDAAKEYDFQIDSISHIKRALRPFIKA